MTKPLPSSLKAIIDELCVMTFYERFEQVIVLLLSAVITVIVAISFIQLVHG